ncbi:MAG TPA: L-seryl-tRNA(Sec) selenium transferase [Pyrinomonadaceae bacterium]|nr:L-seryl-tRNA(Sec) selenium transferase [Pyrinomonadaceae bacterium]
MSDPVKAKSSPLRALPSVDQILRDEGAQSLKASIGVSRLTRMARQVTEELRLEIQNQAPNESSELKRESLLKEVLRRLDETCRQEAKSGLRRVINATGVILHTNLGRAPLSELAKQALAEAAGYCTLEYDLQLGIRGRRGARVEDLLKELTGAEDALVANNCAAASLLTLTVLAKGGETVVSRGELVEIGGDFRVPEVMANSGTQMVEVGTTNRTSAKDYRRAFTTNTRLLMRVHPSNYRVVGFTAAPSIAELVALSQEVGVPLYVDAGSGALKDLTDFGLHDEPVIRDCIAAGADVVSFSGDKLLGATQAGIIVGRADIINRLRHHPLYRALRADKLCLAALEATLSSYARGSEGSEVPVMRMLAIGQDEIERRANAFVESINTNGKSQLKAEVVNGESAVGGGSGPNVFPKTALIALGHPSMSAIDIERRLRSSDPPIIARIEEQRVLLDLRTTSPQDETDILSALEQFS